jgi:tetratricopeptide (TPR) repeat protein
LKFKTLYILFNAVIVAAFLIIFLLPLALLGVDYFRLFAQKNWIAGALFLATLIIINGYFALNWKLFRLLEREDWPALIRHLEDTIYRRGRLAKSSCRLLLNAYLITGKTEPIAALEARVRRDRPGLLPALALPFGLPYLLRGDPQAAADYFGPLAAQEGVADRGWLRWNYAFSLMQLKRQEEAGEELQKLLRSAPATELRLLSLYMLAASTSPELRDEAEKGRAELAGQFTPEQWRRRLEGGGGNPQVTLLAPILREAREWLAKG